MKPNTRMTQSDYSALAKDYILTHHPSFAGTINYKEDGLFDCSIQSDKKHLFLWIATYDTEITIGFEDANGKCDWHTHMSLFNAYEPEEEFTAMTELLQKILLLPFRVCPQRIMQSGLGKLMAFLLLLRLSIPERFSKTCKFFNRDNCWERLTV